jgi:predicted alpha/beta hydrolase
MTPDFERQLAAVAQPGQNVHVNTEAEDRQIDAHGFALASSVFEAPRSDTIVVINAATGVPRYFYRHFAAYLRDQGWTAVTYDYRGIGGSAPPKLRGFEARMRDWALLDMSSVFDWVAAEFQPRRIFSVGHSFGGQGLGLIDSPHCISAAVGVSAQSGYWRVQVGREKYKVWFAVTVLIPVFARLFGFFPWSKLAPGEDLPKGVALEWARWARSRNYLLDDRALPLERYESFEAPILAYSIDDDGWGGPTAVDAMMRAYPNVTRRHLVPAEFGLDRLGHTGFFRKGREPIWNEMVAWLENPS